VVDDHNGRAGIFGELVEALEDGLDQDGVTFIGEANDVGEGIDDDELCAQGTRTGGMK